MKIQKKIGGRGRGWVGDGGRVGGVRVDVNEKLNFLGKFTKKHSGGGGVREGAQFGGLGWWGGGGQGGCERRIEVFVKIPKKNGGGGGCVGRGRG